MTVNTPQNISQQKTIDYIKQTFSNCPDDRQGKNTQYAVSDAMLSAFSVFFMQSPSFLAHQRILHEKVNKSNLQTLFATHKHPSDAQIRNIVDNIPPSSIFPVFHKIYKTLDKLGKLKDYQVLNKQLAIALDGTQCFSSKKIHCSHCCQKQLKDGTTCYYHSAITPVIVSPKQSDVIPLTPEFITNQDGNEKQDCELKASARWLEREREHLPDNVTLLGDDLYSHQPWCEKILATGWNFVFTCKPSSHKTLYEWLDDFERQGDIKEYQTKYWNGKQHIISHHRFMSSLPLRNSDDALMVNWLEVTVTNAKGKILYRNAFITNHDITHKNIADLAELGRTRWKIENENNNTLKTKGYHFEHNFGHGSNYLSSTLATLIILAFLLHTVLGFYDVYYQTLKDFLPRETLFNDIRALTRYMPFDNWENLLRFMIKGLELEVINEN